MDGFVHRWKTEIIALAWCVVLALAILACYYLLPEPEPKTEPCGRGQVVEEF